LTCLLCTFARHWQDNAPLAQNLANLLRSGAFDAPMQQQEDLVGAGCWRQIGPGQTRDLLVKLYPQHQACSCVLLCDSNAVGGGGGHGRMACRSPHSHSKCNAPIRKLHAREKPKTHSCFGLQSGVVACWIDVATRQNSTAKNMWLHVDFENPRHKRHIFLL
jgi:hypothetical protein